MSRSTAFERLQAENVFGIDRVRVAPQRLDPGDAERPGTVLYRRARRRPWRGPERVRLIERAREGEIAPAAFLSVADRLRARAGGGREALQKTRGDGRLAAALLRPAQDRLARPERGDEIMRGLADSPFRRREAERGAHRPVEEGVGLDRRRPDRFVEARQQHAIELEQARLEETEDLQARVTAVRRRRPDRGERLVEQYRVFGERGREALGRGFAPFVHELRQRLEPPQVFARVLRLCARPSDGRQDRCTMQGEAVAKRGRGLKRTQGSEHAGDIARQRLGRLPVMLGQLRERPDGHDSPSRLHAPPRTRDRGRRAT